MRLGHNRRMHDFRTLPVGVLELIIVNSPIKPWCYNKHLYGVFCNKEMESLRLDWLCLYRRTVSIFMYNFSKNDTCILPCIQIFLSYNRNQDMIPINWWFSAYFLETKVTPTPHACLLARVIFINAFRNSLFPTITMDKKLVMGFPIFLCDNTSSIRSVLSYGCKCKSDNGTLIDIVLHTNLRWIISDVHD